MRVRSLSWTNLDHVLARPVVSGTYHSSLSPPSKLSSSLYRLSTTPLHSTARSSQGTNRSRGLFRSLFTLRLDEIIVVKKYVYFEPPLCCCQSWGQQHQTWDATTPALHPQDTRALKHVESQTERCPLRNIQARKADHTDRCNRLTPFATHSRRHVATCSWTASWTSRPHRSKQPHVPLSSCQIH